MFTDICAALQSGGGLGIRFSDRVKVRVSAAAVLQSGSTENRISISAALH